ncbi:vascular endothelial growth factor C-like protein [Leptotrombidium deliense]|uniref:Vascular endothelial growth factor C-like protein n=1 Tax=Leptotrombidium deliense TaxID=299467 RepID=A0A443SGG9_9ACAR|nr:vascular endothelial growth factor C-like protein [Leptotrombidium deliense]
MFLVENKTNRSLIISLKTVRVQRCGGCCLSPRQHCVPTKITTRQVRRTAIQIKRSAPELASQTTPVEVHEECQCQCKIKKEDCNPAIHVFDDCNCNCKNRNEMQQCHFQADNKVWDSSECKCKCRRTQHCSTGLVFSHDTCSCQQVK